MRHRNERIQVPVVATDVVESPLSLLVFTVQSFSEIHEAGLLLVVRTLPGSAHAIAAALDRARWAEVAGSIAGDDTLFVAFPDRGSLQRIKRRLIRLTEGATAS